MRTILMVVGWLSVAVSAAAFVASPWSQAALLAFRYMDPFAIAQYRLARLDPADYERYARQALEDGDTDDARGIASLAELNGKKLPPEVIDEIVSQERAWAWRSSAAFADGFLRGTVDSDYAIAGSILSDFMVVGDVRDAVTEGYHIASGEKPDKLILALALFGIVTTAAVAVPGGQMPEAGASAFKTAAKAARAVPEPAQSNLLCHVGQIALEAVDMDAAQKLFTISTVRSLWSKIPFPSVSEVFARFTSHSPLSMKASELRKSAERLAPAPDEDLATSAASILKPDALKALKTVTSDIAAVAMNADMKAAVRTINLADDVDDAQAFAKLSAKSGKQTSSTLRILGKSAIHAADLLLTILGALATAILWALWLVWMTVKTLRVLARAAFRARRA